jgi:hypothetical protein
MSPDEEARWERAREAIRNGAHVYATAATIESLRERGLTGGLLDLIEVNPVCPPDQLVVFDPKAMERMI